MELLNRETFSADTSNPENVATEDPFVITVPEDTENVMTVVLEE